MSTILTTVENVMNSNLAPTVIGGLFTFAGAWLALRHQLKAIKVQETTRLRWEKRWEVIDRSYSLLTRTFFALRSMLYCQDEAKAREQIQNTWKTWTAFQDYSVESSVFLPKPLAVCIGNISKEFMEMASDLSHYVKAQYSDDPGADGELEFYRNFKRKYEKSLIDGDIHKRIEQLGDELREYLDR